MIKKFLQFLILIMIVVGNLNFASAYDYPKEFWGVNERYEAELKKNNHYGVIYYGNEIIRIMKNQPESHEKRVVLASRYKEVGLSYLSLGDYKSCLQNFQALEQYVKAYPEELQGWAEITKRVTEQLTPDIKMFTDRGTPLYYGAVNEKKNGVLFGTNFDGQTRLSGKLGHESMVIIYQELGQELIPYNKNAMKIASQNKLAVEFALNCPKQADNIINIKKLKSYLAEISKLFELYPDIPVYLRFGAEFDVWENMAEADEFIEAFRYVSDYFKSRHSNVCMVWSPNQESNYNINVDDYYPGDSYVDWVGLSSYAVKYFLAQKNNSAFDLLWFKAGENSHPAITVKKFVEKYGDRKPLMISESGSSHHTFGNVNEYHTDFALERLEEYYTYLPMVYPQIKAICHFDNCLSGSRDDFSLSGNDEIAEKYINLTQGNRFIQDTCFNETDYCYREITDGTYVDNYFEVSTYAHIYGTDIKSVSYYIDGVYAGQSDLMPFSVVIDGSGRKGSRILKAVATGKNGETLTVEKQIVLGGTEEDVEVEISGKKVEFDTPPMIYNDRTMVPMRKIFEALGAKVTWNEKTNTATGKKGDRTVEITIGHKNMYVNNKVVTLDTAPFVVSDRTLVPVRAIAEGLGCTVDWNGKNNIVSITPKVAKWSEWSTKLPSYVNEDLYYIQEKTEYKYRERVLEKYRSPRGNKKPAKTETDYGEWSEWSTLPMFPFDGTEVETQTRTRTTKYFYAHYCTGNISDSDYRYRTDDYKFHESCSYHELGWYDYELEEANDKPGSHIVYSGGEKYRCPNTCYRWYLMDTKEEKYTVYRYRDVEVTYYYWEWDDWSDWDDYDPYEDYDEDEIDVDERTVYRYKEK